MSYLGQNSKSSIATTLEDNTLKKIAQFISSFHKILLPRTNNRNVYRDLSEEEDFLLTNLQQNSYLHSILAGCLAIDSCLSNILIAEKAFSKWIIQIYTKIVQDFHLIKDLATSQTFQEHSHITINKAKDNITFLVSGSQSLPFIDKQKLKGLIQNLQKVVITDQSRPNSLKKTAKSSQHNLKTSTTNMAETESEKNFDERSLQQAINAQRIIINNLKNQFARQKAYLNRQINRLQDQLKAQEKFSNDNLMVLVQELQFQIDTLKAQRRHDERLILQIQDKMNLMSIYNNKFIKQSCLHVDEPYKRLSKVQGDNKNQRVKSSYMKYNQRQKSRGRHFDRNKFLFDIFNEAPLQKSVIRDHENGYRNDLTPHRKLHHQKSANFRVSHTNGIQELQPLNFHADDTFQMRTQSTRNKNIGGKSTQKLKVFRSQEGKESKIRNHKYSQNNLNHIN